MSDNFVDKILQQHFAKREAKTSISDELLRGLHTSPTGVAETPLNPVLNADTFTTQHSTNRGIMNEGMGNIISTLDGVANRDMQREIDRNAQAAALGEKAKQDRKAILDFAIQREGVDYNRGQDAVQNALEAKKLEAQELATKQRENSPTNQLAAHQLEKTQETEAQTEKHNAFLSEALSNAVDPTDSTALVALGRKYDIGEHELGDLIGKYGEKYQGAVATDEGWTNLQTTATDNILKEYDTQVYNKQMKDFQNNLMDQNQSIESIEALATGEVKFVSGSATDIVKTFIEGEDKGLFSPNDIEDLTGFLKDAQKISNGLGVDVALAKDALLMATGGTYTFGRTDTDKEEALENYKEALKAKGFGTSELAKANRALIDKNVKVYNDINQQKQVFQDDVNSTAKQGATTRYKQSVQHAYSQGEAPVSTPTFAKESAESKRIRAQYFPDLNAANRQAKDKARIAEAAAQAEIQAKKEQMEATAKLLKQNENNAYLGSIAKKVENGTATLAEQLMLKAQLNAEAAKNKETAPPPVSKLEATKASVAKQKKLLEAAIYSRR